MYFVFFYTIFYNFNYYYIPYVYKRLIRKVDNRMSTCDFAIFAPENTLEFYTEIDHGYTDSDADNDNFSAHTKERLPKYLTPLTINKTPRVFKVSSKVCKDNKYPAIALFKNPKAYKTLFEPEIDSYLVKGIGIVPSDNVICEGEIFWSLDNNESTNYDMMN